MKTAKDPRHLSRIKAFEYLFSYFFNNGSKDLSMEIPESTLAKSIVEGVIEHKDEIDEKLNQIAPQWTVENMKLIDLTILRIGLYEGFITESIPTNVAIDESIELAKSYGDDNSSSFVNGVLGAMIKK